MPGGGVSGSSGGTSGEVSGSVSAAGADEGADGEDSVRLFFELVTGGVDASDS